MNFDAKISPIIAFAIIIAVALTAVVIMESSSMIVAREMDAIMNAM